MNTFVNLLRAQAYFPPLADKGDCAYKKARDTLAVIWKDKREETLLTTVHLPQMVLSHNLDRSTRQSIMKPECVPDYNTNMCLVDKADGMISSIECARTTLQWYNKLFFHPVDITMVNAHVLFKEKTNKNPTLQDFVMEIIREMLEDNVVEHPSPGCDAAATPERLTGRHLPAATARQEEEKGAESLSCLQAHKEATKKWSHTRHYCRECDAAPGTEPCVEEQHTLMQH